MGALEKLAEKWGTPAGGVLVIGLIIWLVQLNFETIRNGERLAKLEERDRVMTERLHDISIIQSRTTAIQESLIGQVESVALVVERLEPIIYMNMDKWRSNEN